MQHIHISDQLFRQAQQRASEAGFPSVDEYIAEIVETDVNTSAADYDHFFTPEVVGDLHQIHAEMQTGGKTYTTQEVDEYLRRTGSSS